MLEEIPLYKILTPREQQALDGLLSNSRQANFNGQASELEQSILRKTGMRSIPELVSMLHRELIRSPVPDQVKAKAVDHFLNDPRFQRLQVFADQCVRILDNTTHEYLYINEATEHIIGWKAEDIRKGGLMFGHRITHPWDLLQVLYISARAMVIFRKLSNEDKLNSRLSYDLRIRHKNGEYRRIQQHCYTLSVTKENKPGLLMIVSNDITSIKTSTKMHYVVGVTRGNRFDKLLEDKTSAQSNPLSPREVEILQLTAQGLREEEIGKQLKISTETVKTHRKHMLHKTGCKNALDLVRKAVVDGWILQYCVSQVENFQLL